MNLTIALQNVFLVKKEKKELEALQVKQDQEVQGDLKVTEVPVESKETMDFLESLVEMVLTEEREKLETKEVWEKKENLANMVFLDFLV